MGGLSRTGTWLLASGLLTLCIGMNWAFGGWLWSLLAALFLALALLPRPQGKGMRMSLAHAFSLEDPAPRWTPEDEALLDRLAGEVARRGLSTPAVLLLESVRPLNFVGSQAMVFLQPLAGTVLSAGEWARAAALLERREALSRLTDRIAAPRC